MRSKPAANPPAWADFRSYANGLDADIAVWGSDEVLCKSSIETDFDMSKLVEGVGLFRPSDVTGSGNSGCELLWDRVLALFSPLAAFLEGEFDREYCREYELALRDSTDGRTRGTKGAE